MIPVWGLFPHADRFQMLTFLSWHIVTQRSGQTWPDNLLYPHIGAWPRPRWSSSSQYSRTTYSADNLDFQLNKGELFYYTAWNKEIVYWEDYIWIPWFSGTQRKEKFSTVSPTWLLQNRVKLMTLLIWRVNLSWICTISVNSSWPFI